MYHKNFGLLGGLFCLLLTGCLDSSYPKITGSGVPASEQRAVSPVSEVQLYSVGTLVVNPGTEPRLTVEADDNLLSSVKSSVSGETLRVGVGPGSYVWNTGYPRITLEGVKPSTFELSGQTQLVLNQAELESAKVSLSGQSNATLTGDIGQLNLSVSGQSAVTLTGKISQLTVDASGQCQIDASGAEIGSISGSMSGQSTLTCRDSADVKIDANSDSLVKRVNSN